MKQIHCKKPSRPTRDFSFTKFFHPEKSPLSSFSIDPVTNLPVWSYYPKHKKNTGKIIWDSFKKGTFIRPKTIPV